MSNAKLVAFIGVAVTLFGYAAFTTFDRPEMSAAASTAPAPDPVRRASAPPPPRTRPAPSVDVREQIDAVVEAEAMPEVRADNVPDYLAQLERHAREEGQVTALHVEPGLQALAAAGASVEELSASLRGADPEPELDLGEELDRLEGESNPDRRARLIERYLAASRSLPPVEQAEALARLDRLVGADPAPTDP
jgi:hypothetical protein